MYSYSETKHLNCWKNYHGRKIKARLTDYSPSFITCQSTHRLVMVEEISKFRVSRKKNFFRKTVHDIVGPPQ